ncbi:MAG: TlpA family protein disulfide reductase [Dehalococcoidia bacterium]
MKSRSYLLLLVLAAVFGGALLAAACGDGSGDSDEGDDGATNPGGLPTPGPGGYSVVLSTADLAVGQSRVAFVIFKDEVPVTDTPAFVRFFKIGANNESTLKGSAPIPWAPLGVDSTEDHGTHNDTGLTGVYYVNIAFDEEGQWGIGVSLGDELDEKGEVRLAMEVRPKSQAPGVGSKAISVDSLTLDDAPLKAIDTSPEPDESFHQLSIAEALASGKPSVIAFATPSFCETRTCGPSMEVVSEAAAAFQGKVNFVHVEPYKLDSEGVLQFGSGNQRQLIEAGIAWGLPSEPWVFVVDSNGTVVARFEGPYTLEELMAALEGVAP